MGACSSSDNASAISRAEQREESERREYVRLGEKEPHLRDTKYRELTGSKPLMHAWERWSRTNLAMRLRGLLSRFK